MALQTGHTRDMLRRRWNNRRCTNMTCLAEVLLVADHAAVTVPGSQLAMAAAAEEVGVIARHFRVVTGLAGLLAMALQTGFLVKGADLAMRTGPLWPLMRLRLGLLVAGLALLLGVTGRTNPLIDPLSLMAMGLLEGWILVPRGSFLTADGGVAKCAIIRITTGPANL